LTIKRLPILSLAVALPVLLIAYMFNFPQPTRAASSTIYHVSKIGNGSDGLDWTNAFTDVQDALGVAVSGDEIWVTKGIYTPGVTVTETFQLVDGVETYGGFAGTETLRTQRNYKTNPTILSGDIGGDDTTDANGVVTDTANISGNNSYNVVAGSGVFSSTVLDGFTITAGQADGNLCPAACGGGVYNFQSSPTMANVTFSGNLADNGGGMYNFVSSPILTNVTFSGNSALFIGGGMYSFISSPILTNVTFSSNWADEGGGMFNDESNPILTDVIFSGNWADNGGGIYNYEISNPILINVLFSGNWAVESGGGLYNTHYSNPILTNVTFSGNRADDYGGGMINYLYSDPTVINSIFWNNLDSQKPITGNIVNDIYSTTTLTNSLVGGSGGSNNWIGGRYLDGGNNIDADPLFITPVDPATAPTTAGDLNLSFGSPAIDKGSNSYVVGVSFDLDGNPRIINGTVDMGAYESFEYVFLPLILR
jgi:hypothetical protein